MKTISSSQGVHSCPILLRSPSRKAIGSLETIGLIKISLHFRFFIRFSLDKCKYTSHCKIFI